MEKVISVILLLSILISGMQQIVSAAEDDAYAEIAGKWQVPDVVPPAGVHPRVCFTAKDIDKIRNNMTCAENASALALLEEYLSYTPIKSESYSSRTMAAIEAKAFYYAVFGDEKAGAEALEGIDIIKAIRLEDTQDVCRIYGRMIYVLAEIYDWCYGILGERKNEVIKLCIDLGEGMEMGWPPAGQGAVTGHGSEAQLLRDYLAFAIAVADERPDIWNYIGGRFYEEYVPVRKFTNAGHYNHQGTNYGFGRECSTSDAYMLITGMGAPEPYPIEDLVGTALAELYMKRPDGNIFYDGDIYSNRIAPFDYYSGTANSMLIRAAKSGNGYLKGEYLKQSQHMSNGKTQQTFADSSPVLHLILNDPDIEVKNTDTLPQAMYFGSPYGIMAARTSWNEGTNANSAAAMMKIGEYMFNNHQHLDSGNFEIYYKGMLATEGGKYDYYGTDEHYMYTTKTIAHNCMLVYDPDEVQRDENGEIINSRSNINDGGQRAINNYLEVNTLDEVKSKLKHAEILAHEIDPENTQKPGYTYLKGDLTDSYSDKVSDYQRSFVFLDLKDEEVPAAMVVFDHVTAKDKTFKKTWLLHSLQLPVIDGNKAVFENKLQNGDENYSGRMELETLLPAGDNLSMSATNGAWYGFGLVNQYKYSDGVWKVSESKNYAVINTEGHEYNAHKLEVSPKTPSNEDYFLNVISVGDAGKSININAPLFENDEFYGTCVKDRAVFFAKDNEQRSNFGYTMPEGSYRYTICDMAPGKYIVSAGGKSEIKYVSEDGGVLSFEGAGGEVFAARQSSGYVKPQDAENPQPDDRWYVKQDGRFLKQAASAAGGAIRADILADSLGYSVEKSGTKYIFVKDGEKIAEAIIGSATAVTSGGAVELSEAAKENSDQMLLLAFDDLCKIFAVCGIYSAYAKTIYLDNSDGIDHNIGVTAYRNENEIRVNVKLNQIYTAKLMCALYDSEGTLTAAGPLGELGDGKYTALFGAGDFSDIKIFPWTDNQKPFAQAAVPAPYASGARVKTFTMPDGTFNLTSWGVEVSKNNSNYTYNVKKTSTNRETAVHAPVGNYPLQDKGFLHYSTYVKYIKSGGDGERIQFRLRGSAESTVSNFISYTLPYEEGSENKLDVIVDLENSRAHIYLNGKRVQINSLAKWVNSDGTPCAIRGFETYFVQSEGYTGGEFELFDSFIEVFDENVQIDEIIEHIGCSIIE